MNTNRAERIASLDVFRVFAIFAVILIHSKPFQGVGLSMGWNILALGINQGARFAVPFFFVTSGYLLARKIMVGSVPLDLSPAYRQIYRLLSILIFWSVVYLVFVPEFIDTFSKNGVPRAIYWNLLHVTSEPWHIFASGTRIHLWFIAALIWALVFVALWAKLFRARGTLSIAISLYFFGLTQGSYAWLKPGFIPTLDVPVNFWFAISLFMIGWWLAASGRIASYRWACFIACSGMLIHFGEVGLLQSYRGQSAWQQDILLGTVVWAVGLFLIVLSKPNMGRDLPIGSWGRWTLGVYAVHLLVQDALVPIAGLVDSKFTWVASILMPVGVYAISLFVTVVMGRWCLVRRFVQ